MKAYFIRSAEAGEEKGPFDIGEIMIFYRGGDLSASAEVLFFRGMRGGSF